MGKLREMHRDLAAKLGTTVTPHFPIIPRDNSPIVRVNRWIKTHDQQLDVEKLIKEYEFSSASDKVLFIKGLTVYEEKIQHHANINIQFQEQTPQFRVQLELWTRNINIVTESDKEYAKFADSLYREIIYNKIYE